MASIFSYNADPPRVSSPWLKPQSSARPSPQVLQDAARRWGSTGHASELKQRRSIAGRWINSTSSPPPEYLVEYGVSKLQPEPQDGPHEYKLHLLLRPRRVYTSSTTSNLIKASPQSTPFRAKTNVSSPSPVLAPSNQSRQARLQQLTTQLLWRLQQSSPYHASSTKDSALATISNLPQDGELPLPGQLPSGLEESRGALYEIGVADDGSLVGLTQDEMEESLANLHAMAASIGCRIEVLRRILVGSCDWTEMASKTGREPASKHHDDLWVAEVLVTPDLSSIRLQSGNLMTPNASAESGITRSISELNLEPSRSAPEQLRVTLTGPTLSGKTSLLGTLSLATLDNGRGKSRMSHLKHQHELESGRTSSITQDLFGYKNANEAGGTVSVINYSLGRETWPDIHTDSDRVVFVCDSAGHPRYRRTTVRGLVGWAPHWTLLCIAANDSETRTRTSTPGQVSSGGIAEDFDLAKAHLDLCLRLELPLAVIITKLDLVSTASLRETISKVLTSLKAAGRIPKLLAPDQSKNLTEKDLISISEGDERAIRHVTALMAGVDERGTLNSLKIVPIIITSAATGSGIRAVHALLHNLPIPPKPTSQDLTGPVLDPEQPATLFHIEEQWDKVTDNLASPQKIVSGHVRFGSLTIGDAVILGPFPADVDEQSHLFHRSHSSPSTNLSGYISSGTESSSPGAHPRSQHSATELSRLASYNAASMARSEWVTTRIVSIRNLRLPAHTLEAGQVGTIGLSFESTNGLKAGSYTSRSLGKSVTNETSDQTDEAPRVRKGMVLAIPSRHMYQSGQTLQASSGLTVRFDKTDVTSLSIGMSLPIYFGSVRATARVLKLSAAALDTRNEENAGHGHPETHEDGSDVFSFRHAEDDGDEQTLQADAFNEVDASFELLTGREFIELGAKALIMPGGGNGLYYGSERGVKGVAGLEGIVGRIMEVFD